jgi:hypothetical protein
VGKDPNTLSGESAAMQNDLNLFLVHYVGNYFSTVKSVLAAAAPGVMYLGPTNLGGWGNPARSQILQAASPYVDVLPVSMDMDQPRVDFVAQYGGDKPWITWEGRQANPDSYMSPLSSSGDPTQAIRGQNFRNMVTSLLNAKDSSTGALHNVGYKWWEYYDNRAESANWGLLTRRDNAYDGAEAAKALGVDSWGFATGGERSNYGDFIDDVTNANTNVYKLILNLP